MSRVRTPYFRGYVCHFNMIVSKLNGMLYTGWWPQNTLNITRLVSTFCSSQLVMGGPWYCNWYSLLRKKAHLFIAQHYQWDPNNHHEKNIMIVKQLLGDSGLFLKDGIDDEVM